MLWANLRSTNWRGMSLVAITYVYFLIFAQFAFIRRLADLRIADAHLNAAMAAMAFGGILFSLLAPRLTLWPSPVLRLRVALGTCALAAVLTLLPFGIRVGIAVAFLTGSGLGLLTVALVTHLRKWLSGNDPLLQVGIGTGLGYFVCNFPPLFNASPTQQAIVSAALCAAGMFISPGPIAAEPQQQIGPTRVRAVPFFQVLVGFTALVWLDSAAFFIVQHTPELKVRTWEGVVHLWTNGTIHFAAALLSVWMLRRYGLTCVLCVAFVAFAAACLLLRNTKDLMWASVFYPVGVSLYSVALVAYPALLTSTVSAARRAREAGWIYAVAGWFGSAMGIGMGQHLGRVPLGFLWASGILIFSPGLTNRLRSRRREIVTVVATLLTAEYIQRVFAVEYTRPLLTAAERGRLVYISEGCISCHSQYVRPDTSDVILWGPTQSIAELRRERPPLIGNRRQGPDLSEVGGRRSALWLRAHLSYPAELSRQSIMPSYSYLFRNHRGDDLVGYLSSLRTSGTAAHMASEREWRPSGPALAEADPSLGASLFQNYCATCHSENGRTRERWHSSFRRLPPNLSTGPFHFISSVELALGGQAPLWRIIKFGIPGTDMPGHEYLNDKEITSLSAWLTRNIVQPSAQEQTTITGQQTK